MINIIKKAYDKIFDLYSLFKKICIHPTKNRNLIKLEERNITILQRIFFPICFLVIHLFSFASYPRNSVITIVTLFFFKFGKEFVLFPELCLFIMLMLILFNRFSIRRSKLKKDWVEIVMKKIATPKLFLKFKYSKRMARLRFKQSLYNIRRLLGTPEQEE